MSQKQSYLLYAVGKDAKSKPAIVPVQVEASGADIQRKVHIQKAEEAAKAQGLQSVSEVLFADAVNSAVEKGVDLQGDAAAVCVDLHNELRRGGELKDPPEVNDPMWRIAEAILQLLGALPRRSKVQFIKSIGSNQPSWDRAVYGVFRTDEKGKPYVDKLQVEDLSELKNLKKAGMNMEFFLRILSKAGVLEPIIRMIERRSKSLVELRKTLELDDLGNEPAERPEILKISTKRSDNETRNPF